MIVNDTHRLRADFVVVGQLVGNRRNPGLLDARHVVIPQIDTLLRITPVRHPAEIGGINIGGDAILETVQLIRSDKMHLAGKAGAVTHEAQVVGEGRHRGRQVGGIVVTAAGRYILAGHESVTRRGT